jgi:hypothetical protein
VRSDVTASSSQPDFNSFAAGQQSGWDDLVFE